MAIKAVTDENDLMIINKSGILIRMKVSEVRVMGRATQGVRLINLTKKNDSIASVCKVMAATDEEALEEENAENQMEVNVDAVDSQVVNTDNQQEESNEKPIEE